MFQLVSVAQAKNGFSQIVNQAAFGHERTIICRHGRPVAAVVGLDELEELDRLRAERTPANLAAVAGQWKGFDEIAGAIDDAFACRQQDFARDVSLE